jgi:hypothetical protein
VWLLRDSHKEEYKKCQVAPKLMFELLDNSYYYPVTTLAIRSDGAMLATGRHFHKILKKQN